MTTLDPGHNYLLDHLDGPGRQRLVFVKRQGPKYPGNVGSHEGTTTQEVLRAVIDRLGYVHDQEPCPETEQALRLCMSAVWLLESRAARKHGRVLAASLWEVVKPGNKCSRCGHVGCEGGC